VSCIGKMLRKKCNFILLPCPLNRSTNMNCYNIILPCPLNCSTNRVCFNVQKLCNQTDRLIYIDRQIKNGLPKNHFIVYFVACGVQSFLKMLQFEPETLRSQPDTATTLLNQLSYSFLSALISYHHKILILLTFLTRIDMNSFCCYFQSTNCH